MQQCDKKLNIYRCAIMYHQVLGNIKSYNIWLFYPPKCLEKNPYHAPFQNVNVWLWKTFLFIHSQIRLSKWGTLQAICYKSQWYLHYTMPRVCYYWFYKVQIWKIGLTACCITFNSCHAPKINYEPDSMFSFFNLWCIINNKWCIYSSFNEQLLYWLKIHLSFEYLQGWCKMR